MEFMEIYQKNQINCQNYSFAKIFFPHDWVVYQNIIWKSHTIFTKEEMDKVTNFFYFTI